MSLEKDEYQLISRALNLLQKWRQVLENNSLNSPLVDIKMDRSNPISESVLVSSVDSFVDALLKETTEELSQSMIV
jgi:hypothetical protein